MNSKTFAVLSVFVSFTAPGSAWAEPVVGKPAPAFKGVDWDGKPFALEQLKGKTVVLEWHNPNCPFVKKHYDSANIPKTQEKYSKQVVWVAINTTNPSHRDFMTEAQLKAYMKDKKAAVSHYVMDKNGEIGKAYAAKTTPQLFIIGPTGTLLYNGAIDSIRSADVADIVKAKNYVNLALDELAAGKPVTTATSTPYGCSVKY